MTRQPASEQSIFLAAIEQESPEARAAYLEQVCGDRPQLRAEMEALLTAHDRLGSLPAEAAAAAPGPLAHGPGARIGPYKLLERIGEGGMGEVWMAEQEEPVRRKVALKIIKPGMDTKQVVARFEAERQALALMDHPNIAKVFDGGTTSGEPGRVSAGWPRGADAAPLAGGRPYFVMELVKGTPITKYCDEHRLTPRQRLELFVPVCQAIQHAHQKGIIHRDVKPSNILVAPYDGQPVVKVIDFGIAKAAGQRLTDKTLFTGFGALVGTLEYMSPEQAELNNQDIDTRSDIYSLGVLLYELLTGTTPLTKERLKQAAFDEVLRLIREEEPPKPSTRLSDSKDSLPTISAQRQTQPTQLTKLVRGELDWIVLKCLEKDRNRRYETADGLARDLERYLTDEPVQACPPSAGYRLRKFVRRNRGPVVAAAAILLLLVGGVVGTTWGLVRAEQARRAETERAEAEARERKRAETAEQQARDNERKANEERKRADEEKEIAKAVNDFFLNDLLAEAAPEKNPRDKKVTVEELLGRAAERIAGKFEQQPRLEGSIRLTIGATYYKLGNYSAAQPHLERALELLRRTLEEEHHDTSHALNFLALTYQARGQFAQAEPLLVKALELGRRVRGEEHSSTLAIMNNLAVLYRDQGRFAEAESLWVKVLEVRLRAHGQEHPQTLAIMNNLGQLYVALNRFAEAEPLYVKALELGRCVWGEEHPDTLTAMHNLAVYFQKQRRYAQAEPLYVKALELRRRALGEEHPRTLNSLNNLAVHYQSQGQFARAEPLYREALAHTRKRHGEGAPPTADALESLGVVFLQQEKYADAEPLLRECLKVRDQKQPDAWTTFNARSLLGSALLGQQQYAEAERLLRAAYEGLQRRAAEIPAYGKDCLTEAAGQLMVLYEAWGKPDRAAEWRKKLAAAKAGKAAKSKQD